MKKFIYTLLFSIFLISCATIKVEHSTTESISTADNTFTNNTFTNNNITAHKELRELFENYSHISVLIEKGFDLDKLDKINNWKEMKEYLESFFIDEDGYPIDNNFSMLFYSFYSGNIEKRLLNPKGSAYKDLFRYELNSNRSRVIKFSDEYGTKAELLAKGYIENENMFRCPFYGRWVVDPSDRSGYSFSVGTWHENGYRVGQGYMAATLDRKVYNYISDGNNYIVIGLTDNTELENTTEYIKQSKKDYLILDLTYSQLTKREYIQPILEAIKEMNPKKILILISSFTSLYSEVLTARLSESEVKVKKIGQATKSASFYNSNDKEIWHSIDFDGFQIIYRAIPDKKISENVAKERLELCPDYYTIGDRETVAVVNHIIGDSNFYLPTLDHGTGTISDKKYDANMMIYLGQKSWSKLE